MVAAGLVGVLAVAPGGGQAEAAQCEPEKLPVPKKATDSWVSTGSPSGDILAGKVLIGDEWQSVLWVDGKLHRPKIPLESPDFAAVNSDGLAVGFDILNGRKVGFAYQDGKYTKLPTVHPNADADPAAVNENGIVVGSETIRAENGQYRYVAVRWSGKNLQRVEQLRPTRGDSIAQGIDADGTAVGYQWGARPRAYAWKPDGSGEFLPTVGDHPNSQVTAIRGGWAIGNASSSADESVELRWDLDGPSVTRLPTSVYAAYDVNSSGAVAVSTNKDLAGIVHDGQLRKLPGLGKDAGAYTISDSGRAAGAARDADNTDHAVVWRGCES